MECNGRDCPRQGDSLWDMVRGGITVTESLFTGPFRAVRDLFGRNNSGLKEAASIGEDLASLPFKFARKIVDYIENPEAARETQSEKGPSVKNILVNPEVNIIYDKPTAAESLERRVVLEVKGLICDA